MKKIHYVGLVLTLSSLFFTSAAVAENAKKDLFKEMDTDADERVSIEEYMSFGREYTTKAGKSFNEESVRGTFRNKDRDQDGFLSSDELSSSSKPPKMSLEEQKKKIAEAKKKKAEEEMAKKEKARLAKEKKRQEAEERRNKNKSSDGDRDSDSD